VLLSLVPTPGSAGLAPVRHRPCTIVLRRWRLHSGRGPLRQRCRAACRLWGSSL